MSEILDMIFKYYIGIVLVGISSAVSLLYIQFAALRSGMRSMLRNSIVSAYNKAMDKEFAPVHERDNVQQMYCAYKDLKGNGNVKALVDEIMRLPTREKVEKV